MNLASMQKRLEKLEEGYQRQAIPEASVRQARRDVEADLNALARAERTLRVWRLSDAEINVVKAEAERIRHRALTGRIDHRALPMLDV